MTKKLVIIDDSSTQLNILKTLFSNNGWEVCGVQSAKIGYELIFDFAPDLIITDAIMPLMGGFQLVKMIRENELISKIPVIVYSVLNENNAKFYINEELSEYFLKKENNHDELLELAQEIVAKFPLDEDYKKEILRESLKQATIEKDNLEQINQTETIQDIENEEPEQIIIEQPNMEEFREKIKECSNFTFGDEKIFSNFFNKINNFFGYDLGAINIYSFEDGTNKVFFDIRDIILSPILRNSILKKYDANTNVMYKKYAPNLPTMVNESEFLSKIEFNFKYKEENIANIVLFSREKLKWQNEEINQEIEKIFYEFFKARYIQKASKIHKKEDIGQKYNKTDNQFDGFKNFANSYYAIVQIVNFSDFTLNLSTQEIDILNSKISEKIIACLEDKEQVYKNDEDEYSVVILAKDEKQAKYRFEYIINEIEQIDEKMQLFIAASSCNIDNGFNIVAAQKNVNEIMQEAHQEKVVIYNVWE